jgi:hypothetical protein
MIRNNVGDERQHRPLLPEISSSLRIALHIFCHHEAVLLFSWRKGMTHPEFFSTGESADAARRTYPSVLHVSMTLGQDASSQVIDCGRRQESRLSGVT